MFQCKYPHLFTPITLGKTTFKNRIFASPTGSPMVTPPEYLKKECTAFYELRARGGAAVVTLGDGIVHTPTGLMHPYKLRLDDPAIIPSFASTARSIRQYGAIPSAELSHGGKFANVANFVSKSACADLPAYGPDHEFAANGTEIFEMPEEIIGEIVAAFGRAAGLAKQCGYGMVIVHGGHGWLLQQFMSPATNHRTDKFGGSLENRCRFALMVLDSIRAAVGPDFPVEFRMSGAEFTPDGYTIDDGVEIAKLLAPKVNLLHVSAGVHDNEDTCIITHPSMFHAHGCNVFLAERIKKAVDVPVATVGGLNDPAQMEEILASGRADVVEMSRALTADPYLPYKALHGQEDKIVRCIRCFQCLNQTADTRNIRCALNPLIGRELENKAVQPPAARKKVLVVGGGPAGMEFALTAAQRGHDVTLCEAEGTLGGQLNCEKYVPFKKELYHFAVQMGQRLEEAGVKVLLNTRVTPEWAEMFAPDTLVCAVGAGHVVPDIPGIDGDNVRFLPELKKEHPDFGHRVVILGAGLVGCETAVHLIQQGHAVTVVGRNRDYAKDATLWHKEALRVQMEKGVDLRTGMTAAAVTPEGVLARTEDGKEEFIPADTVFCAVGVRSNAQVRESLRFVVPDFIAIGDCDHPGQMFEATSRSFYLAQAL